MRLSFVVCLLIATASCGRIGYRVLPLGSEGDVDAGSGDPADRPVRPDITSQAGDSAGGDLGLTTGETRARDAPVDAAPVDAALGDARAGGGVDGALVQDLGSGDGPGRDLAHDAAMIDALSAGDSAIGDAGAAAVDMVPVPTACTTEHANALYCVDFDDPAYMPRSTPTGQISVDRARSARGGASLHIHSLANGSALSGHVVSQSYGPRLQTGTIYLRAFFYVPAAVVLTDYVVLMEARGPGGKISFDLSPNTTAATNVQGTVRSTPGAFVRDRWLCAELTIDIATNGRARLSIDGQGIHDITNVNTLLVDGLDLTRAGAISSEKNADVDVWVDDFVVSRSPIGCK